MFNTRKYNSIAVRHKLQNTFRPLIKAFPTLYRTVNRARGWRISDPDAPQNVDLIGGDGGPHNYGAWALPLSFTLEIDSTVYAFGVGYDISFDLELIRRFGVNVHAFDPGAEVAHFLSLQQLPNAFVFHPFGLSELDGEIPFELSPDSKYFMKPKVIDTAVNRTLITKRLSTILRELGHTKIDLLKMDIEGFEYNVIEQMLDEKIFPACILVEFHHYQTKEPQRTKSSVNALRKAGYEIFWISDLGAEYGFTRTSSDLPAASGCQAHYK